MQITPVTHLWLIKFDITFTTQLVLCERKKGLFICAMAPFAPWSGQQENLVSASSPHLVMPMTVSQDNATYKSKE